MKKLLIISLTALSVLFFVNVGVANASSDNHGESVEEVLSKILTNNNFSTIQEIECDQIADEELEMLGDAVMELQHPGEAHIQMDAMMGGEGSDTLRNVHIHMGENYLGCGESYGSGMMGGGMMGFNNDSRNSHSSYFNKTSANGLPSVVVKSHFLFVAITWVSLIAFLLSGVYFFLKASKKKRK